ncbi:hypothetical protein P154DRAFT_569754 [Amniculicola lignicola CBS 123094]|uniref:Ecp2 effector protein domain-containing protein n=1 Tax=Amniculicola lignicola CBS 123094 TaxID=1392246 RepID=A0A6A5X2F1_9PLEO|nr:hypothetical protein P154DRAFT_569754 [Amniculicola lignicola CBS 123094]
MAPKIFFYLFAAAGITTATAAAVPDAAPAPVPFTIPSDVEILDLRTEEDKKSGKAHKRTPGGVYVCKAIEFDAKQGCKLIVTSWGNPTSLIGTEYNNVISSAGADVGTNCQFFDAFSNGQCTGQGYLDINNPGLGDFRTVPWAGDKAVSWNDITTCIKCWY